MNESWRQPRSEDLCPRDVIDGRQVLKANELVVIDHDRQLDVAGVDVAFYHIDHATIYQSSPCKNLAVKVGDELYYPGDSLHPIDDQVRVVAIPISVA